MSTTLLRRRETAPVPHRFTVEDFHVMGEVGLLNDNKRYELLEGEIIERLPLGPFHGSHVDRLSARLFRQLPERYHLRCQGNVQLSDLSEPLPDFAVFRHRSDEYSTALPTTRDILLLIEVADSSLAYDRDRKARIYGHAGVPEYWIVDTRGRQVLVFRKPRRTGYGDMKTHAPGDTLRALKIPELSLAVNDLLVSAKVARRILRGAVFDHLVEILDPEPHAAALNMAIDEALLRAARAPTLRIYRWIRPAVSFGYFGKWADVERAWPERDIVRRWTGGGIVPHGDDVTDSLIVPRAHPFARLGPLESYRAIHEALAAALGNASLATRADPKISDACFENAVQHDVLFAGRKIAGAAQRRSKSGLLHQGSIQPVGDSEAIVRALRQALARHVDAMRLTRQTCSDASRLVDERYGTREWLRRR